MFVTLEIESGPLTGRRIWLRSNELAQVGRTEWTDFAVPSDEQLADVHFAVFANCTECRVRDLQSPTGTSLNGIRVRESPLHTGDKIQAGSTVFKVTVDGEPCPAEDPAELRQDQPFCYRAESCAADLPVYTGEEGAPSAATLAEWLSQKMPLYLLVRFGGSHLPLPSELAESADYVTVNTNPAWLRFFPLLVSAREFTNYGRLIEQAWSDESVVCAIFTDQPIQRLLAHLKTHAASFSGVDVLREQLNCCPAGFVNNLLDGLPVVMLKDAVTDAWRLYLNESSDTPWQDLGFACPPSPRNEHSTLTSA